jgi:hypothetical protein
MTGSATPIARTAIRGNSLTPNLSRDQQKSEKIPKGSTTPTGPLVRVAHAVNPTANHGIPRHPRSHQQYKHNSAPAILVASNTSTRQVVALRNHSLIVIKMRDALTASEIEASRATKAKNAPRKTKYAIADGSRAVSSVTSPPGKETSAISQ